MTPQHDDNPRPNPEQPNPDKPAHDPAKAPEAHKPEPPAAPPQGPPSERRTTDSVVDLDLPGVVPPLGSDPTPLSGSGHSNVNWASLVDSPKTGSSSSIDFEASSDADMQLPPAPAAPGDSGPSLAPSVPSGSSSSIDLSPKTGSSSSIDFEASSDADMQLPPVGAAGDSGPSLAPSGSSSSIDLGGKATRVLPPDAPGTDSSAQHSPPPQAPVTHPGIDLLAEEMARGEPAGANLGQGGPPGDHAGRDPIAEAVESGVDLQGPPSKAPESEVPLGELPPGGEEEPSSAVDLGGDAIKPQLTRSELGVEGSGLLPLESGVVEGELVSSSTSGVVEAEIVDSGPKLPPAGADEILEPEVEDDEEILEPEVMPSGAEHVETVEDLDEPVAPEPGLPPLSPAAAQEQDEFLEGGGLAAMGSSMGGAGLEPLAETAMPRKRRESELDLGAPATPAELEAAGAAQAIPPQPADDEGAVDFLAPPPSGESVPAVPPSSAEYQAVEEPAGAEGLEVFETREVTGQSDVVETGAVAEEPIEAAETFGSGDAIEASAEVAEEEPVGAGGEIEAGLAPAEGTAHPTRRGKLLAEEAAAFEAGESPEVVDEEPVEEGEPAGAGEAIEEAAEEAAEEGPPARKKKEERARGRGGVLVGTLLGVVIGAGTTTGLWMYGIEPPASWKQVATPNPGKRPGPGTGPGPVTPSRELTAEARRELMQSGDLEKIKEAGGFDKFDATDADQRADRGRFAWLTYRRTAKEIKADDEPVKAALEDLKEAIKLKPDNSLARLDLGRIQEALGQLKEARATYTEGVTVFKDKPETARIFQAALDRLDTQEVSKADGASRWRGLRAEELLLCLVLLQEPPVPMPEEAGFDFWKAVKLAKGQKYDEALKALADARKNHDQRRKLNPSRAQNPTSDPDEQIFLKTCDELKAYWQLRDALKKGGYKDLGAALAVADKAKGAADKITKLEENSKADALKIKDLEKDITTKTKEANDLKTLAADTKTKLDKSDKDLADAKEKLVKATGEITALTKANAESTTALAAVSKELADAQYVKPGAKGEAVTDGLRMAIRIAKTADPKGELQKLMGEVTQAKAQLKERWTPEQLLAYWRPLLEAGANPDAASAAIKDADRVLADKDAGAASKGRAETVRGLALRNAEKFAEAKAALEKALPRLGDDVWRTTARAALKEVSDPAATFRTRAEALRAKGQDDEAVALLAHGLGLFPDEPRLLVLRGLVYLDKAEVVAGAAKDEKALRKARADAEAAAKGGSAEGHYVAGRVAEETGDFDAAVKSYRAALAAHKAQDAESARYRVALARVLTRAKPAGAKPGDAKLGRAPSPYPLPQRMGERVSLLPSPPSVGGEGRVRGATRRGLVLMMLTMLADPPSQLDPRQEEAQKLADEILAKPEGLPPDVIADALAIKGRYTQALKSYVEGLAKTGQLGAPQARRLMGIIEKHPFLKRPETLARQDPLAAERFYFNGRSQYNNRRWADAERSFRSAIEQFGQDARYFYFLGLTRLAQDQGDFYEYFRQGAQLERQNHPDSEAIDRDLERVQGNWRRVLNEARRDPR
jgi:hypothetical protein